MGSDLRFDYSAVGDAVNLASRLEGKTRDYDVPLLVGPETARLVGERFGLVEIDRIAVKGRREVAPIFTLAGTWRQRAPDLPATTPEAPAIPRAAE